MTLPVDSFDYVVIGGGSAGFSGAIKASDLGASVAMIDGGTIGGTCVNVGCVPSKRLLTVGEVYHYGDHDYNGITLTKKEVQIGLIVKEKDDLVLDMRRNKYAKVIHDLPNAKYIEGSARFVSRSEVIVNGRQIKGRHFLLAAGSSSTIPGFKGLSNVDYLTNVEALSPRKKPESLIVIGGRVLGLEFAQMYAHFGTKVTLLQRSSTIIPDEEPEISEALRHYLQEEGISIHTSVQIKEIRKKGRSKVVSTITAGKKSEYEGEQILMATGRAPNTGPLGLQGIGVKLDDNGAVKVNNEMRSSIPNIWAAGDIIGEPMLETVAAKEGSIAAHNAFSKKTPKRKMDFTAVPHAIFTMPQVASVGMTDIEANQQGITCSCNSIPMSSVAKAGIVGDTRGLVKLVIDDETKRVLGVHILSSLAADMIHEGALIVKFKLTIDDIIDTVHIFPTMSEAIKLAAQSFYKDIDKMSCCTE
ncbi:MAG: mercury(II) reductase [Thaumarchaeota archaeon]|nr:mercury(II) reductase [Nitrososphaerota archaeon]